MHIANISTIKVTESNCYSLACAKISVFQHNWFVWEINRKHGDIWVFQGQYSCGYKCYSKTVSSSAEGQASPGTTWSSWTRSTAHLSHHAVASTFCPSSPTTLIPLPNPGTNERQNTKRKIGFSGCGENFETFWNLLILLPKQPTPQAEVSVFTSRKPRTYRKKMSTSVPGTKCLQIWGNAPPVGLVYLQVLFLPRPKKVAPITGAWPKGSGDIDSSILIVWF